MNNLYGKESLEHKNAKELLRRRILQDRSFSWAKKTDRNPITGNELLSRHKDPEECVLMEVPSLKGDIPRCICRYNESFCVRRNEYSQYGDGNGYYKCNSCDHRRETSEYITHDIAALSKKNRIRWAIEVVATHEPEWERREKLKYPVFLVKSNSVIVQLLYNEDNIQKENIFIYARILNGNRGGRLFERENKKRGHRFGNMDTLSLPPARMKRETIMEPWEKSQLISQLKIPCPKCGGKMVPMKRILRCDEPGCDGILEYKNVPALMSLADK